MRSNFILLLLNVMAKPCLISDLIPDSSLISNIFQDNIINKYFNNNFIDYLNFENFNYLFVFTFLVTFIPNFIPNIQENFNNILYGIFLLFYLIYTIYNVKLYKKLINKFPNINKDQLLLIFIIIFIIIVLFVKQFIDESSKFHNFIYFSIIIFCFFIIFLLKKKLFFNPFEKLGYLIGLNWHKLLFILTIIFILSFVYYMINFYFKEYDTIKCTKENIKKHLADLTYDQYDESDQVKNQLCKYFNATNQLELINKINSFNFDEDGCFNYNDLIKILKKIQKKKIYLDNDFKDIKYHIIIVIGIISAFLYKQLKKFNIKGRKKSILTLLFFSVNSYFITNINNSTIYKSCEINKVKCKDKLGDNCKDKYYKMDFNKQLNEWITYALISSFLIIAVMFYYNILNTQKLIEKDKIFIICFVIIIIICSFLLLQNNIIQN